MISEKSLITVDATVNAPVEKVWECWTGPVHIMKWNYASDDWHTTMSENDLREGGRFLSRMEAKNGSTGFDFTGEYRKIEEYRMIECTLDDGRNVHVEFLPEGSKTRVIEAFEAENQHSFEQQKEGWQAILNNFKRYCEKPGIPATLYFDILIDAPTEKVYETMLSREGYKEWTSEFDPTSRFEGSWEKGSVIYFTGTGEDGKVTGMLSRIRENIPGKYVSIEHFGIIREGKEITDGPDVEKWAGSLENYILKSIEGKTLVSVEIDSNDEFRSYFQETWPKALERLKSICEK